MRRTRHTQRDLFDEAARVVELRPDLRAKLTPLLQALLAEAACVKPPQATAAYLGDEEAGDDENHA